MSHETNDTRTDTDAVIEVAQQAVAHTVTRLPNTEGVFIGVLDDEHSLKEYDLEKYLPAPRRKHGSVTLQDAESFCAYVNRHKTSATVLYAQREAGKVVAVLNDHDTDQSGWGDHRATLVLAPTKEWVHWIGKDGKLVTQHEFAEHIEQGIDEIVEPPAADMLELAQHFEAKSKVAFKSARLLNDGSRVLQFEETIEAKAGLKGDITIPREFQLGIAPYEGTDPYRIVARLRYRLVSESLTIGYVLVRVHDLVKAAFQDVLDAIASQTSLTPLLGTHD